MKAKVTLLIGLFWMLAFNSFSGDAPVVKAGSEYYPATTAASVYIPITVEDFNDIGFFRLTLNYPTSNATWVSGNMNTSFGTATINGSTPGTVIITWTGTNGISLPDQTTLVTLVFTYISGNAGLNWDLSGTACQFKKYAGGLMTDLNDLPKTDHYKNGRIVLSSPLIQAASIINAQNGLISVPVTVEKFMNISSGTLYFSYDTTVLTYQSAVFNNLVGYGSIGGNNSAGGTRKFVTVTWYNLNPTGATLTDGSLLCTISFQFNNQNNTFSTLSWYDSGPSCKLYGPQFTVLNDLPSADFYKDGLVASAVSPETKLPVIPNATAAPGVASVPVKVTNFKDISSLNLWFSYDPAVLSLPAGSFSPHAALGGTMVVDNITSCPDGKARVHLTWTGSAVTLPDNSDLITFGFNLTAGGASKLEWSTGGDSCQYQNTGKILWKYPITTYFKNGIIGTHLAPVVQAPAVTANAGQTISIPLPVNSFSNITGFTLTLKYDPAVLAYQNASLTAPLGGTFTSSNPQPGQMILTWTGSQATVADGSTLATASFTYTGGTSALQWYTTPSACGFSSGSPSFLYDLPKSSFYLNGSVSMNMLPMNARTKIYLEGPYNPSTGGMTTSLASLIPLTQPFNGAPYNYAGTEQVAAIPANVTDWILVELRTDPWATSRVATRAGFLKNDGMITDLDGTSDLHFTGLATGYYYLVIKHRNHLPVMSAVPVSLTTSGVLYDFSTGSAAVYGGASGYKNIDQTLNKWGMIAGDANLSFTVFIDDYTDFWLPQFGSSSYLSGDFNLDGSVFINDYTDYWMVNFGRVTTCP